MTYPGTSWPIPMDRPRSQEYDKKSEYSQFAPKCSALKGLTTYSRKNGCMLHFHYEVLTWVSKTENPMKSAYLVAQGYANLCKGGIIFYREGGASICDRQSSIFSAPPPLAHAKKSRPPLDRHAKNFGPPFALAKNILAPPFGVKNLNIPLL